MIAIPQPPAWVAGALVSEGWLPMPPSVNKLWVGDGNKRTKTTRYKQWINDAGWEAKVWLPIGEIDATRLYLWAIWVDCGQMTRMRDCDNTLKATQDLIANLLWLPDTHCDWAAAFRSENHDGKKRARVTVAIWEQGTPSGR